MQSSVLTFIVALVGLVLFVWWIRLLVEMLRTPTSQWEAAEQSQLIYVILMVLLNVLGAILYVTVARPQLRNASNLQKF